MWVPGIITAHSGPLSYEVKVAPNTVWRQHIDQLRESSVTSNFNKEQYTSRLNPAVLAATPQSASTVENEELQAPTMSGMRNHGPKIHMWTTPLTTLPAAKVRPWLAVQQHHHADVIPFGYRSHQRD